MLVKKKSQLMYLLSKNLQIKLLHRQLGYASNTKVVKISKLSNGIKIMMDKEQQEEHFFSDFKSETESQ